MKKRAAIFALILSCIAFPCADAGVTYFGYAPYNCTSTVAGFNLTPVPDGYILTGALYVPYPGYQATISAVNFSRARPQDAEATLTLIPPAHILTQYALRPLTEVPPVPINYGFSSTVPIHRLTISIANPVNRFDTQITCLPTGVSQ
jgi:hypothetical protein